MASTQEFCSYFNHKASSFHSYTHMNTLLNLMHTSFLNHFHMAVRWDVKWFPVSMITTLLARRRPFHWISTKRMLVMAAKETAKFQNWSHLTIVAAVTWLKYCRYGVKLYPINESINHFHLDFHFYLKRGSKMHEIYRLDSSGRITQNVCKKERSDDQYFWSRLPFVFIRSRNTPNSRT